MLAASVLVLYFCSLNGHREVTTGRIMGNVILGLALLAPIVFSQGRKRRE